MKEKDIEMVEDSKEEEKRGRKREVEKRNEKKNEGTMMEQWKAEKEW